jgi:hypothetical protein
MEKAINKKLSIVDKRWLGYNSKIKLCTIRLILYIIILVISISFLVGSEIYRDFLLNLNQKSKTELESYNNLLEKNILETKQNLKLLKKYNKKWKDIPENRLIANGISLKLINKIIGDLNKKYNIAEHNFTMTVPKKIKDQNIEDNKKINIFKSNCQLSFNISDDIRARLFVKDLKNAIYGYLTINKLSINKLRQYEFDDLVKFSNKESSGIVEVKLDFNWYAAKKK